MVAAGREWWVRRGEVAAACCCGPAPGRLPESSARVGTRVSGCVAQCRFDLLLALWPPLTGDDDDAAHARRSCLRRKGADLLLCKLRRVQVTVRVEHVLQATYSVVRSQICQIAAKTCRYVNARSGWESKALQYTWTIVSRSSVLAGGNSARRHSGLTRARLCSTCPALCPVARSNRDACN